MFADPIQQVRVCFVTQPGGTVIELVEPLSADSPVNTVIGSQRGGVTISATRSTTSTQRSNDFAQSAACPLARPVPAVAFGGRRIVFLMTPQRDLIELVEAARE